MAHFAKVFERKAKLDIRGDKRAMQRLRRACENVKRALSTQTSATIELEAPTRTPTPTLTPTPTPTLTRAPTRTRTRTLTRAPSPHPHPNPNPNPEQALKDGVDLRETISRARFEELNMELFRKTMQPVATALKDAKMDKGDIDEVVLIGGSTRIPKAPRTES